MPRKLRKAKHLIYVFCEGESEQAYTDFLKKKFADIAVIKRPKQTGLFEEAKDRFLERKHFIICCRMVCREWKIQMNVISGFA